jgi:hypothetical protein
MTLFLSSCEKPRELVEEWKGQYTVPGLMPPVCAVWYRPGPLGWLPYKCFAQADELRNIMNVLIWEANSEIRTPDFASTYKLSLMFYKGTRETLAVREICFDLSNDTFVWPYGKSEKLGRILIEKEVWGDYYGRPDDANMVNRIKQSQEWIHKEVERLQPERERDAPRKIEEPNLDK